MRTAKKRSDLVPVLNKNDHLTYVTKETLKGPHGNEYKPAPKDRKHDAHKSEHHESAPKAVKDNFHAKPAKKGDREKWQAEAKEGVKSPECQKMLDGIEEAVDAEKVKKYSYEEITHIAGEMAAGGTAGGAVSLIGAAWATQIVVGAGSSLGAGFVVTAGAPLIAAGAAIGALMALKGSLKEKKEYGEIGGRQKERNRQFVEHGRKTLSKDIDEYKKMKQEAIRLYAEVKRLDAEGAKWTPIRRLERLEEKMERPRLHLLEMRRLDPDNEDWKGNENLNLKDEVYHQDLHHKTGKLSLRADMERAMHSPTMKDLENAAHITDGKGHIDKSKVVAVLKDIRDSFKDKKTSSLRGRTIRLAYENPDLRPYLLPLIQKTADQGEEEVHKLKGGKSGSELRNQVIRLAYETPRLRAVLLPLLKENS